VTHGVGLAAWPDYVYGDGHDLTAARSLAPLPLKPAPGLVRGVGSDQGQRG
jgi:hypothetical protein